MSLSHYSRKVKEGLATTEGNAGKAKPLQQQRPIKLSWDRRKGPATTSGKAGKAQPLNTEIRKGKATTAEKAGKAQPLQQEK